MTMLREEVLRHLWKRFPQHCVVLTDPCTRRAIDVGIERAARHGFRDTADVRSFVVLMLFLGSHFDEDPQLPWAAEHLRRTAGASRRKAMAGLLAETSERMQRVVGLNGEYYRHALARAHATSFETVAATYDDTADGLRTMLHDLHFRKYTAAGADGIARLIDAGRSAAVQHGLVTPPGTVVYLALMFLLGSAIDRDPFHPWVNGTLAVHAGTEPTAFARALHAAAIEMLRRHMRLDQLMGEDEVRS